MTRQRLDNFVHIWLKQKINKQNTIQGKHANDICDDTVIIFRYIYIWMVLVTDGTCLRGHFVPAYKHISLPLNNSYNYVHIIRIHYCAKLNANPWCDWLILSCTESIDIKSEQMKKQMKLDAYCDASFYKYLRSRFQVLILLV